LIGHKHLLAVQINSPNAHPAATGHSGAVGLAIMVVGLALVARGMVPLVRFRLWRTHALSAVGFVVENVPQATGNNKTSWLPIIEFQANGETVMSLIPAAESPLGWPLGDPVDVLYDPVDPHRARLARGRVPVSGSLITGLAIIGVYLALVT
jgi:hypothetical protein